MDSSLPESSKIPLGNGLGHDAQPSSAIPAPHEVTEPPKHFTDPNMTTSDAASAPYKAPTSPKLGLKPFLPNFKITPKITMILLLVLAVPVVLLVSRRQAIFRSGAVIPPDKTIHYTAPTLMSTKAPFYKLFPKLAITPSKLLYGTFKQVTQNRSDNLADIWVTKSRDDGVSFLGNKVTGTPVPAVPQALKPAIANAGEKVAVFWGGPTGLNYSQSEADGTFPVGIPTLPEVQTGTTVLVEAQDTIGSCFANCATLQLYYNGHLTGQSVKVTSQNYTVFTLTSDEEISSDKPLNIVITNPNRHIYVKSVTINGVPFTNGVIDQGSLADQTMFDCQNTKPMFDSVGRIADTPRTVPEFAVRINHNCGEFPGQVDPFVRKYVWNPSAVTDGTNWYVAALEEGQANSRISLWTGKISDGAWTRSTLVSMPNVTVPSDMDPSLAISGNTLHLAFVNVAANAIAYYTKPIGSGELSQTLLLKAPSGVNLNPVIEISEGKPMILFVGGSALYSARIEGANSAVRTLITRVGAGVTTPASFVQYKDSLIAYWGELDGSTTAVYEARSFDNGTTWGANRKLDLGGGTTQTAGSIQTAPDAVSTSDDDLHLLFQDMATLDASQIDLYHVSGAEIPEPTVSHCVGKTCVPGAGTQTCTTTAACPSDYCAKMDVVVTPNSKGTCLQVLSAYYWNGSVCLSGAPTSCFTCEGADCDSLFSSQSACESAFSHCEGTPPPSQIDLFAHDIYIVANPTDGPDKALPDSALVPGANVFVKVRLENIGANPTGAGFPAEWLIDVAGAATGILHPALAGNTSSTNEFLSLPWTIEAGDHTFTFIVDSGNIIRESNDNNNQAIKSVHVGTAPPSQIDLYAHDIYVVANSADGPDKALTDAQLVAGQQYYVKVVMENIGDQSTDLSFVTQWFLNGLGGEFGFHIPLAGHTVSNQTALTTHPVWTAVAGDTTFKFITDSEVTYVNGRIRESNELNNITERTIHVGGTETEPCNASLCIKAKADIDSISPEAPIFELMVNGFYVINFKLVNGVYVPDPASNVGWTLRTVVDKKKLEKI